MESIGELMNTAVITKEQKLRLGLKLYPPLIRNEIVSDDKFYESFGIESDFDISFVQGKVSFQRSLLFDAIKRLSTCDIVRIKDNNGTHWKLTIVNEVNASYLELNDGENNFYVDQFSILFLDEERRLKKVLELCQEHMLDKDSQSSWVNKLNDNLINDEYVSSFYIDLRNSPVSVDLQLRSDLERGQCVLTDLVPKNLDYYERLIGKHKQSKTITEFSANEAKEHYSFLLENLDTKRLRYLISTLNHSSLSKLNAALLLEVEGGADYFNSLALNNPSQYSAALEVGLWMHASSELDHDYLEDLVNQLLISEDIQYELFSAIFILIYGELSHRKVFANKPVFYKRLAALSHATLVIDALNSSNVILEELAELASRERGVDFACQTLIDLHSDPRWFIDYIEASKVKADLIGRVYQASANNEKSLSNRIKKITLGKDENSLSKLITMESYLPSPTEGNVAASVVPPEFDKLIKNNLYSDSAAKQSFTPLINLALYFNLDENDVAEIVKRLRENQRQINSITSQDNILFSLSGFAKVAAVTKNKELANELTIVNRVYRNYLDINESLLEQFSYGVIAAASFEDKREWANYIGNWMLELSYLSANIETMKQLRIWLNKLCMIEPTLFAHCGKAIAVLSDI